MIIEGSYGCIHDDDTILNNKVKSLGITLIILLSAGAISAQPKALFMPKDQQIFKSYITYIEPWQSASAETLLEKTATFFLESPYVAHTLEMTDKEVLIVNLREFDCFTFVETVIALAVTARSDTPTIETFAEELQSIRYRDGEIKGYSSRLHYTSDWVYENEKSGVLKNISAELGGVTEDKVINFMSAHRDAYKQLKSDDELLQEIISVENRMNQRGGFIYLPKANIDITAPLIPHMAMIGFTTSIEGLDTTHVGFAFRKAGKLTFIHASSAGNSVVIDERTLSDYCNSQKSCTGIIVVKVL